MAEETVLYSDSRGVRVTNARAIFGNKTYAMANISSVSIHMIPAKRGLGIMVALFGGLLLLCGAAAASGNNGSPVVLIIGLLVMGAGIALAVLPKHRYAVTLSATSGELQATVSTDKTYIESIVNAMNEAMVHRG